MMKKLFYMLLLLSCPLFSQVSKVHVYGNGSNNAHDSTVAWSFIQGYQSTGGTWNGLIDSTNNLTIANAVDSAFQMYIYSYTSFLNLTAQAQQAQYNYRNILVVSTAGSNSFVQVYNSSGILPCIVSTGGGDANNETGYDIEFFSNDPTGAEPDLSSFSNGFVAGQLAYIANQRNCSLWEARYCARETASSEGIWTNTNGYGKIDIDLAIAFQGSVPDDPYIPHIGTIGTLTTTANGIYVSVSWQSVTNATSYQVYRNGAEVYSGTNLSMTDTLSDGVYIYKYKALMNSDESQFSSEDTTTASSHLSIFTDLPVKNILNNKVYLSYQSITNAINYDIYKRLVGSSEWTLAGTSSTTTFIDSTAVRNIKHTQYKIAAKYLEETSESEVIDVPFVKIERLYFKKTL